MLACGCAVLGMEPLALLERYDLELPKNDRIPAGSPFHTRDFPGLRSRLGTCAPPSARPRPAMASVTNPTHHKKNCKLHLLG